MNVSKWLLVGVMVCIGANVAFSATGSRIGVVDVSEVVKVYDETKTVEDLLAKQLDEFEAEHRQMRDQIESLKGEFDKAQAEAADKALSDEAREAKLKIARDKLLELREFDRRVRETVMQRRKEISEQRARMHRMIVEKVSKIVADYAKEKGFGLVVDSSAVSMSGVSTVLYAVDKIDITEDVVKTVTESQKKNN